MAIDKITLTVARASGRTSKAATKKPGPGPRTMKMAEMLLDMMTYGDDCLSLSDITNALIKAREEGR